MTGVLDGVRVLSLAGNLPGPVAAAQLVELGAAVTKVESPAGDQLQAAAPGWYAELVAGQRVVVLDLKTADGRERLDGLLADADLLLTSHRPSTLRRLGLGQVPDAEHPHLSHVEIVGHDGADEEIPGHDLTFQAAAGTLDPPRMPLVPVADLLGAERAVSACLAATLAACRTGRGSRHRVVLENAAAAAGAAARHGLTGSGAPLGGGLPTYGIYASSDGYVALAAIEPAFRERTLRLLGTKDDPAAIAAALARRPGREWEALAADHNIPLVAVRPTVATQ